MSQVQPTFDSTMLLVTKVQGYTAESAGTTVKYGTAKYCDSEGAPVSESDFWLIQARYRTAPTKIERAVQTTRHIRVRGGILMRGIFGSELWMSVVGELHKWCGHNSRSRGCTSGCGLSEWSQVPSG
jgi:hypothetical protein